MYLPDQNSYNMGILGTRIISILKTDLIDYSLSYHI